MNSGGLPFPDISPELFSVSLGGMTFALRWYALAYIAGILIGWRILVACARRPALWGGAAPFTARQAEEFLTWAILGVILGGRLGYVAFYAPAHYLAHPLQVLQVWSGGMSFHGGFLGVVAATALFARRHAIPLPALADAVALAAPPGLLLGRLANFVNGELWGRPTAMPWGVIFPGEAAQSCATALGPCARHPSQLYEAGLEGLVLGLLLWLAVARFQALARPWLTTGLFLAGYGLARFTVEFFRLADAQYITPDNPHGHVLSLGAAGLTMGQLLSLPMILAGIALVALARARPARTA